MSNVVTEASTVLICTALEKTAECAVLYSGHLKCCLSECVSHWCLSPDYCSTVQILLVSGSCLLTTYIGGFLCTTVLYSVYSPDQPTNVVVTPLSSTQLRVTWMVCVCTVLYSYKLSGLQLFSFRHQCGNTFTQTAFQMSRVEYSTFSSFLQCCTNEYCTSLCYHI